MVNAGKGVTDGFWGLPGHLKGDFFSVFLKFLQQNAIVLSMFLYF
jgi:hypothetical protein